MGTRGAYGFRVNNQDKIGYNHSDSYPGGLGEDVINYVLTHSDDALIEQAKSINVLEDTEENYTKYRSAQGDLTSSVILESSDFLKNGLFCEWAYIVNADTKSLEFYCGFSDVTGKGRYNKMWDLESRSAYNTYPGVALFLNITWAQLRQLFGDQNNTELATKFTSMLQQIAEIETKKEPDIENIDEIQDYAKQLATLANTPLCLKALQAGKEFSISGRNDVFIKTVDSSKTALNKTTYALEELDLNTLVHLA